MLQTIVIGVLAGFVITQAANFATSVYLHRTLSHRAMSMNRGLATGLPVGHLVEHRPPSA